MWSKYDLGSYLGVNLDSVDSIRTLYQQMMNNFNLYKVFVGVTYGQNWWTIKTSEVFG